jgi:hypothetical protein
MSRSLLLTVAVVVGATACARALPPVNAGAPLGSTDAADHAAAAELMREAEAAFAQRPAIALVRDAERLWLEAAIADSTDAAPIMGAVRTQVWLAENDPDPAARGDTATAAVRTAQWCRRRAPADPACPYWLALAVGVQADQHRATASDGLVVMVRALHEAIAAAPETDQAGPHRVLALVLLRAPGWPAGPGDPDTGLLHARSAVEMADGFPPNWLALGEALRATGAPAAASDAYRRALDLAAGHVDPDRSAWIAEAEAALAEVG